MTACTADQIDTQARCEDWGYFDDATQEFVLTTPHPPRPWRNTLWNPTFISHVNHDGSGICYRRDPHDGRCVLLNWSGERCVYLRDRDSDALWALGHGPVQAPCSGFTSRFGLGYQLIEQRCHDVTSSWCFIVDPELHVEHQRIRLENHSDRERHLDVMPLIDIDLNLKDPYHGTFNRWRCEIADDRRQLIIHNESYLADRLWNAYLAASEPFAAVGFDREAVVGTYGSWAAPTGLDSGLDDSLDIPEAPALAGRIALTLPPGATVELILVLGNRHDERMDFAAHAALADPAVFAERLATVHRIQAERQASPRLHCGDAVAERFMNTWLPQQLSWSAAWNRGWGKGYRDGMQDAWSHLAIEPARCGAMIRDAAGHLFPSGLAPRSYAPLNDKPYNDGSVWLTLATAQYVAETGDLALLAEDLPYEGSDERDSCLDHLLRGMRYLDTHRGQHGLCLMPYGDWNDQLTGPGAGGAGESVWTSMAFACALRELGELCSFAGATDAAAWCQAARERIVSAIQEHAWCGEWFARASCDDGSWIGHPDNDEGRLFLLPQAWSLLADIATPAQRSALIAACDSELLVEHGYLLLAPAYTHYDPRVGHLSGNRPGSVENGANYCHATSFMIAALAHAGEVDKALDIWLRQLPVNPENPPSRSHQEPFSVTNSYRGPQAGRHAGRSLFSWRTGNAGWMFRSFLEGICGLRCRFDGLQLPERLPTAWPSLTVERRVRGHSVTITVRRGDQAATIIDGQDWEGSLVPYERLADGTTIERVIG